MNMIIAQYYLIITLLGGTSTAIANIPQESLDKCVIAGELYKKSVVDYHGENRVRYICVKGSAK